MCEDRRTITERILDEQKETNSLLRKLVATPPPYSKQERIKEIQRILGVRMVDGIIGPETRRAFNYLEQ